MISNRISEYITKIRALNIARQRLTQSSYDLYHTLAHHESVWTGCKKIINEEGIIVDKDILEVACFWHDVFKGKENQNELLRVELTKVGFANEKVDRIIKIISEHSFGQDQTLEESKILYDSDKIELVSIPRWKFVFDAFEKGKIDLISRDKYIKEWNRRMPLIENHLHYKSSNKDFSKNLSLFREWLKTINKLDGSGKFISEID